MLKKGKGVKNIALYDLIRKDVKYNLITGFLSCYLAFPLYAPTAKWRIKCTIVENH